MKVNRNLRVRVLFWGTYYCTLYILPTAESKHVGKKNEPTYVNVQATEIFVLLLRFVFAVLYTFGLNIIKYVCFKLHHSL